MDSLIKSVRFAVVAVCLLMTVGAGFSSAIANSNPTEEVSLETVEDGESEKNLHQRRKTNKAKHRPTLLSVVALGHHCINVPALNNVSHRTDRCRMNGFGGYLRN